VIQLPTTVADQLDSMCRVLALEPRTRVVAEAIVAAMDDSPLHAIWGHFAGLFASTERLEIVDHGLFRGDLSDEQMRQGVRREIALGEYAALSSTSPLFQTLLHHLARCRRPRLALEFGTCLGLSTAAMAAGLGQEGGRRLVTIEGSRALHDLAVQNLQQLGYGWVEAHCGLFEDVLPRISSQLRETGVGLVFDDGQHTGTAERERFDFMLPLCEDGAVVIFDDIHQNEGMEACWRSVRDDPHVIGSADLLRMGICVLSRSPWAGQRPRCDLVIDEQTSAALQQALANPR
jgi:predicted O-methyltransferase YrrM